MHCVLWRCSDVCMSLSIVRHVGQLRAFLITVLLVHASLLLCDTTSMVHAAARLLLSLFQLQFQASDAVSRCRSARAR